MGQTALWQSVRVKLSGAKKPQQPPNSSTDGLGDAVAHEPVNLAEQGVNYYPEEGK